MEDFDEKRNLDETRLLDAPCPDESSGDEDRAQMQKDLDALKKSFEDLNSAFNALMKCCLSAQPEAADGEASVSPAQD